MSSGGLRRDFSVMVRLRVAPGASFCFFSRGRGIFGRMYCDSVSMRAMGKEEGGLDRRTALRAGCFLGSSTWSADTLVGFESKDVRNCFANASSVILAV